MNGTQINDTFRDSEYLCEHYVANYRQNILCLVHTVYSVNPNAENDIV